MLTEERIHDLRDLVEAYLGKPLAASTHAGLWRCPVCPPERHALLMVSTDEYRCLSGYPCDGGASEWMYIVAEPSPNSVLIGVPT
jgi:hypothetical protein